MQASFPINRQRCWSYLNLDYPYGIADIQKVDFINLDEAAVFAESAYRGAGKSHITIRCRDDGLYGHLRKTNALLAISGEHATAQQDTSRRPEIWENGGTMTTRFFDLIQRILNNI